MAPYHKNVENHILRLMKIYHVYFAERDVKTSNSYTLLDSDL